MIWNDPWIDVATTPPAEGTGIAPFCTTLPPPKPTLPPELRFSCCAAAELTDTDLSEWRDLVGTRWPIAGLRHRLEGAWIARLLAEGQIVSTCVLRRAAGSPLWVLETLVARPTGHGYATALVRSAMTWIWITNVESGGQGPFVLAYTWELTVAQLAWAAWRGWLKSAAAIEYGWIWKPPGGCEFCGNRGPWPVGTAELLTLGSETARVVVSDSGLGDGLGYVLAASGDVVDWAAVARAGGWRALWWRGRQPPSPTTGWAWTGEIVVVGLLNYDGRSGIPTRWITTEVAPGVGP